MTTEHLRSLLNDPHATNVFFRVCEKLCREEVPQSVVRMVRQGRMTALAKPDGGVRGIVAGDVIRRLVARTMAQQLGEAVENATAPFQYASRTKAGCECVAHVLQGLTELDPQANVTSIDGISAFDLMSRRAMLVGLMRVKGGSSALPFVRLFYGTAPKGRGASRETPSCHSCSQLGSTHPLKPSEPRGEHLFAFLDDIYTLTRPERVGAVHACLAHELRRK